MMPPKNPFSLPSSHKNHLLPKVVIQIAFFKHHPKHFLCTKHIYIQFYLNRRALLALRAKGQTGFLRGYFRKLSKNVNK